MQLGNEEIRYAEYASFWVEDEARLYRLHVDGYNGTAGRCDVFIAFTSMATTVQQVGVTFR